MVEKSTPPEGERKPPMLPRDAVAAVVYRDLKESQRATFQLAGEYGRWLIASLLLIHAGALFGWFSFLDGLAGEPKSLASYSAPIWCFVVGMVLALASGFGAWINWSMHSENYDRWADVQMLWDSDRWIGETHHSTGITATYWCSIVFGLLSAACIVVGTAFSLHGEFWRDWLERSAG